MRESILDRLALNEGRINAIAAAVKKVAALPDPLGSGEVTTRPNGLKIEKTRVPLGVVAIIYEARPNVTPDAACLCLKSGNAVVLRGGKEAINIEQKNGRAYPRDAYRARIRPELRMPYRGHLARRRKRAYENARTRGRADTARRQRAY